MKTFLTLLFGLVGLLGLLMTACGIYFIEGGIGMIGVLPGMLFFGVSVLLIRSLREPEEPAKMAAQEARAHTADDSDPTRGQ